HLTGSQMGLDSIGGIDHKAHVRLAILVQRRRHTEDQGVTLGRAAKVRGGLESIGASLGDVIRRNMLDVALTSVELFNLGSVDIDAKHPKTDGIVSEHEGQTDVSQSDDT